MTKQHIRLRKESGVGIFPYLLFSRVRFQGKHVSADGRGRGGNCRLRP